MLIINYNRDVEYMGIFSKYIINVYIWFLYFEWNFRVIKLDNIWENLLIFLS